MPPPRVGEAFAGVAARARRPEAGSTAPSARPGFPNAQLPQLATKLNWRRAAGESKGGASLAAARRSTIGDEFGRKIKLRK
jgi:hypothetical protein